MNNTKKMVRFSILLSFAIVISAFESYLFSWFFIPGVKIGIANFVSLFVLYYFGKNEFIKFNLLRVLIVGLFRYGLGIGFFISFSGIIFSSIAAILIYNRKVFSIFSISIVASVFHAFGQIIIVMIIYNNLYLYNYFYIMFISSLFAGLIVAMLSKYLINNIPKKALNL